MRSYLNKDHMLPDLPKLKKEVHEKILTRAFESESTSDPLLAMIKHYIQHEGDKGRYQTVDGQTREQDYQAMSAETVFTVEDVTDPTLQPIVSKFKQMGSEAASQMAQYSFKQIGEAIDSVGNTVDAGGKLTPDSFLRVIEKIQIDFDEDTGLPKMPTMFIHPNQAESVRKMIQEAEADPENKKRFDALMLKKKEEWRDREAIRKLVD